MEESNTEYSVYEDASAPESSPELAMEEEDHRERYIAKIKQVVYTYSKPLIAL